MLLLQQKFAQMRADHGTTPGLCQDPQHLWNWQSNCSKCGKPTRAPKDLFCANYGMQRGSWEVYHKSWCGKCYEASKDLKFQIATLENDEGSRWKKKKDEDRFLHA